MRTDYAVDPELAPWISMLPRIDLADVEEARRQSSLLVAHSPRYEARTPIQRKDFIASGPTGSPGVGVRTYTPEEHVGDRLPGLVFFHGGGYVTGSVEMFDNDCVRLDDDVGIVVVSVEYRLAPEHPFPAGLEDCSAAVRWTAEHADELSIDPARLGVGGESAGGRIGGGSLTVGQGSRRPAPLLPMARHSRDRSPAGYPVNDSFRRYAKLDSAGC
jgi:acetyl esterase